MSKRKAVVMSAELLFLRPRVSSAAKELLAYLTYRCGNKSHCWPRFRTIQHDLQLHPGTISRAIRELEDRGLIRIQKGENNSNEYHLIEPAEWPGASESEVPGASESEASVLQKPKHPILENTPKENTPKGTGPDAPLLPALDPATKQTKEAPTDARAWEFLRHPVPDEWIDDPELRQLWFDWILVRRQHRSKITQVGLNRSRTMLARWPTLDTAKEMLGRAVQAGWQGLYPPGDQVTAGSKTPIDIPEEFK